MASYSLKGSYSTVQVISPTLIENVVYCTLQTFPSGVICSMPILEQFFDAGSAGTLLNNFAEAVESIMSQSEVIAGSGEQTIDASGLLADNVVFVVQYLPPGTNTAGITAEAIVPVANLDFSDASSAGAQENAVNTIIQDVYNNLKAAASG